MTINEKRRYIPIAVNAVINELVFITGLSDTCFSVQELLFNRKFKQNMNAEDEILLDLRSNFQLILSQKS